MRDLHDGVPIKSMLDCPSPPNPGNGRSGINEYAIQIKQ
jgi:hypothetical protein